MALRSHVRCVVALGLLLTAGCLYPVTEKVDFTVCNLAAHPRDLVPDQPTPEITPAVPTSQSSRVSDNTVLPVIYHQPGSSPVGPTDTVPNPGNPDTAPLTIPKRLTIPPGLPGASAPPIALPELTPQNESKRREAIAKLYQPLESLDVELPTTPGPEGRPLTLADLQRLGLSNNPLLRQAVANVEAARGAAIQAGAYPNPQVGFEQDTIFTTGGPGYVGGFFDQKIIMGNKLQLARAAATMDFKNAELALRRAETDLMTKVRGGYYAVLVARENVRISKALVHFTTEIYQIQVDQVAKGGIAAPYEPLQLRALAVQAQAALVTARNRYTSAWKQLAASLGLPGMPPTELAGRVDAPIPLFDHDFVLNYALHHHTDVLTAENTLVKAQYNLRLARQTPIPDMDVRVLVQKDYTGQPFNIDPSVQISFPIPVWDCNQGGIIQAQGTTVNASEEAHRVRADLTTRLADAYERYTTNRVLLGYYRDQILPDLVRAYRGIYERYHTEMPAGALVGPGTTSPPQFADVVVGQQNLANAIVTYVQTLGQAWQAVVDVADILQTDDLYRVGKEVLPTVSVAPLPELGPLPPLPCCHPCSPLPDPALKEAHGEWPQVESSKTGQAVSPSSETKQPVKTSEPALTVSPVAKVTSTDVSKPATKPVAVTTKEAKENLTAKLLEPPPDLPSHQNP